MDTSFDFELVSLDDAKKALDDNGPVFRPRATQTWRRAPVRGDEAGLTSQAEMWLAALPPRVAPLKCAEHYPRIVNRIHKLWPSPLFLKDYLQELVLDKRGGRQGFPHGITPELERFRQHYETLHPARRDCMWGPNDTQRR